ncbi:hypothetical protein [Neorhizobium sp. T6_25]|uniref:hypothetical protein n=1 Tax=Neorhizobium sp. T6_25 TaxID=2093833 RepID=UPI000CFA453F|nr:hypothetical protein [Neorhizobium sp. T6_25]
MTGISRSSERVLEADRAEVAMTPDGKTIVIEYDVGASELLRVALPFDLTKDLVARIIQVAGATMNGESFVRLTPVTAIDAQPTDIPGQILLSLYDELRLAHHYSLPLEVSAPLRARIRSAEAQAKRGVPTGRA